MGKLSLRFILGRAGTGKTGLCLKEIGDALREGETGCPLILLVPEQASFQLERALLEVSPRGGTARSQVLSFQRLAWRVLQETGGASRPHLGELGKVMALRAILRRRGKELEAFGRAAGQAGFARRVLQTLGEIKSYGLGGSELLGLAPEAGIGGHGLVGKLRDLALLIDDLEGRLQGRYLDPEDLLGFAAQRINESFLVKGAEVWLDGFSGFTPQEYGVLRAILKHARRVNVALCLDPLGISSRADQSYLFYPTQATYLRLKKMTEQHGLGVELKLLPSLDGPRRRYLSPLAYLERYLYARPSIPFSGETNGLVLSEAPNRRAEVEACARTVLHLVRDLGYRWREISVMSRETGIYQQIVEDVFSDYGIPCFLDRRVSVKHHPLVEFLRAALEVVVSDWAWEPVFRLLKTDLFPLERGEVDRLENYVLAHGIRGRRWLDGWPWTYRWQWLAGEEPVGRKDSEAKELAMINLSRTKVAQVLGPFADSLTMDRRGLTAREATTALWKLLERLGVGETIHGWSREAAAAGELQKAREHHQVWDGVLQVFDQLVEVLGEEAMDLEEYAQILSEGLENLRLGMIPPALDQVLVGSVERSRHLGVRAVLVLGVNDGVFPPRVREDEVLSDGDREELLQHGLELAPTSRERLFQEQFLAYNTLTRPSDFLWVSCALADDEGHALVPSSLFRRLKNLFPAAGTGVEDERNLLVSPQRAAAETIARLKTSGSPVNLLPLWRAVYRWLEQEEGEGMLLKKLLEALSYNNHEASLTPDSSKSLFFETGLAASVSRLELLAACPFAHFATYGLGLTERHIYRLDPPGIGVFFHAVLQRYALALKETGLDWSQIEEGRRLAGDLLDKLVPELGEEMLLSSGRYLYLARLLRRHILRAVTVLGEEASASRFRPLAVEVDFGFPGGLPPLQITLDKGLNLEIRGRIDRLDICRMGSTNYVRVVDYKSRVVDLELKDVYHGLNLQLMTYLLWAVEHGGQLAGEQLHPAAAFYFGVDDPLVKVEGPLKGEELEQVRRRKLGFRGLLLGEQQVLDALGVVSGNVGYLPVTLKKDGFPRASSKVLEAGQLNTILNLVRGRLGEMGCRLAEGEVRVFPYRQGKKTPCGNCSYGSVCGFDPLIPGNVYHRLSSLKGEDLWRLVARGGGGGSDEG